MDINIIGKMLQETNQGIIIKVKVVPKSSQSRLIGWENEELKVGLAAVPEKGEANKELIRFFSKIFAIGKSKIEIIHGETSRHKTVRLKGISLKEVNDKVGKEIC